MEGEGAKTERKLSNESMAGRASSKLQLIPWENSGVEVMLRNGPPRGPEVLVTAKHLQAWVMPCLY